MACWFNPDNVTELDGLMIVYDVSANLHRHELRIEGAIGGDPVGYTVGDASAMVHARTTTGYSAGIWQHACAVGRSATDRSVYLDGGSRGNNTTSRTPANLDQTEIGNGGGRLSGLVADAAVWNVDLTDAEIAILAKGVSPLTVRPQNLVAYWPLVRNPYNDWVGGFHLSIAGNPTVTAHPPAVGWVPRRIGGAKKIVAAGGLSIPVAMRIYRNRRTT